jgi:transcriptional regulator NrdR family protein
MKQKIVEGAKCKYCTVKRKGHTEEFDERKVYASCYAACLSSHVPHTDAEKICEKVSKEIKTWAKRKRSVESDEIFSKTITAIKKHNKDAAFMYETHRDIS